MEGGLEVSSSKVLATHQKAKKRRKFETCLPASGLFNVVTRVIHQTYHLHFMNSPLRLLPALACFCFLSISARFSMAADVDTPDIEKTLAVSAGGTLSVDIDFGSVHIKTGSTDNVVVQVYRKIHGPLGPSLDDFRAAHEVKIDQTGNKVAVQARLLEKEKKKFFSGKSWPEVRFVILVPKQFDLQLQTGSGSVQVGEILGEVKAQSGGGSLRFARVDGPLQADTSSGSIRLEEGTQTVNLQTGGGSVEVGKLGGVGHVETRSGSLNIKMAAAKLTAKSGGGSVQLGEAKSDTTVETASGSIRVNESSGPLLVRTGGGSIRLGKLGGNTTAETQSGSIEVDHANGTLRLKTGGGTLSLGELNGETVAETSSGSIQVKKAAAALNVRTSGGSVKIDDASHSIQAHTSSGSIIVRLSGPLQSDSRVNSGGGTVQVSLPADIPLSIDAQTGGGSATTNLPLPISKDRRKIQGDLNGGGKTLSIRTSSGSLSLNKL
jgi:DUF4097 and DUF4098 domain-containing protein YvlB